jgi:hypothetical protein
MPDRNRFAAQMKRLYDRRGVDFNPAQARVYWDVLGAHDKSGEAIFSDEEIESAVDRALFEPQPTFGIPDVQRLRGFIIDARQSRKARERAAEPNCTPEGLADFGRAWRAILGGNR